MKQNNYSTFSTTLCPPYFHCLTHCKLFECSYLRRSISFCLFCWFLSSVVTRRRLRVIASFSFFRFLNVKIVKLFTLVLVNLITISTLWNTRYLISRYTRYCTLTSSGHNSHAFASVTLALWDLSRKYPLDVSLDCAGGDQLLYVYCGFPEYGLCKEENTQWPFSNENNKLSYQKNDIYPWIVTTRYPVKFVIKPFYCPSPFPLEFTVALQHLCCWLAAGN